MMRLFRWSAGTAAVAIALVGGMLGWNMWTYQRLTGEQWVADLRFVRTGPGEFLATLEGPGASPQQFPLRGEDWQLDARLITWQPWMQLMGKDPVYRLDRIWGRFRDVEVARVTPPSVHPLTKNPGLDLWALARDGGDWVPGVDAAYGSAVFLPMQHNAAYRVTLGSKGLIARPYNDQARTAISSWH